MGLPDGMELLFGEGVDEDEVGLFEARLAFGAKEIAAGSAVGVGVFLGCEGLIGTQCLRVRFSKGGEGLDLDRDFGE